MSFSFLNQLFSTITRQEIPEPKPQDLSLTTKDHSTKQKHEPIFKSKIENELADISAIPRSLKEEEELSAKYLRTGELFMHIYDTVQQDLGKGRGLSHLIKLAGDPQKAESKLKGKSFLLRKNDILRGKKHTKTKKGVVTRRVAKEKALFDVRAVSLEDAKIMNTLWEEYMAKVLPPPPPAPSAAKPQPRKHDPLQYLPLMRCDYHGAWVEVLSSTNPCDNGLQGVVVKETLKTLVVLTEASGVKTVIKEHVILGVRVGKEWFKILGLSIVLRADDRSKFKPKWKNPLPRLQNILTLEK